MVITFIAMSANSPIRFSGNNAASYPYQFTGIDSIQPGSTVMASYGFNSASQGGITCVGSRCSSNCISNAGCIASQGTVIGTRCFLCASGQVVSNNACVNINTCGNNQFRDSTGQCVCNQGYIKVNNICYPSCGANAYVINSQCSCIPGYVFSTSVNQCIQQSSISCRPNYVAVNGVCICPSGYGIINNNCLVCPANSYVNNNGQCTCNTGYTLDASNLRCNLDCMANAYRNSFGQCTCNNGFYMQNNVCIPQGRCQGILVWNGS